MRSTTDQLEKRGSKPALVWPAQLILTLAVFFSALSLVLGQAPLAGIAFVASVGFLAVIAQLESIHASLITGTWLSIDETSRRAAAAAERRAAVAEAEAVAEEIRIENEAKEAERQRRRENERLAEQLATPPRRSSKRG